MNLTSYQPDTVHIGIDWADVLHAYHLLGPDDTILHGVVEQKPKQLADLLDQWRRQFPNARFLIAIEQTKGALVNSLLEHDDVIIYPINPAALANYRKSFAHGGGKNDPSDALLLARFLHHYQSQLKPLRNDAPETRELATLGEDRRRLVDQRSAHCNELKAVLKLYFPVVLELGAAKIYADFILRFLRKYSSLDVAQKAGRTRLRKFFFGVGAKKKAEARIEMVMEAIPTTTDEVTIRGCARRAVALCELIQTYNTSIDRYDAEIHKLVRKHVDYPIVASLPGAADKTHCRMIAALGDDRTRYENAESLQAAAGIAPLTIQSGKLRFVSSRWACTKFMKQTFHEYAGLSIKTSKWAKAYYQQQKEKGKTAQMAKRALAYKWMRIIFRCWQDRVPYDEQRYIERLIATGSPLAKLIEQDN